MIIITCFIVELYTGYCKTIILPKQTFWPTQPILFIKISAG